MLPFLSTCFCISTIPLSVHTSLATGRSASNLFLSTCMRSLISSVVHDREARYCTSRGKPNPIAPIHIYFFGRRVAGRWRARRPRAMSECWGEGVSAGCALPGPGITPSPKFFWNFTCKSVHFGAFWRCQIWLEIYSRLSIIIGEGVPGIDASDQAGEVRLRWLCSPVLSS